MIGANLAEAICCSPRNFLGTWTACDVIVVIVVIGAVVICFAVIDVRVISVVVTSVVVMSVPVIGIVSIVDNSPIIIGVLQTTLCVHCIYLNVVIIWAIVVS